MNEKQLLILYELARHGHYLSATSLVNSLSRKTGVSVSTLKWNLRKLRDLGLIEAGDEQNKWKLTRLTDLGIKVLEEVLQEGGESDEI